MEYLQKIERDVQVKWENEKAYEIDAPNQPRKSDAEKYFVTFPFPYMNGRLHLGHTFSLSKCEVNIFYVMNNKKIKLLYKLIVIDFNYNIFLKQTHFC